MNTKTKGNEAENIAINFLKENGYEIIERNFYFKGGEIDIIAIKDNVLHFIEVKSGEGFEPIYNITPSKLKRIIKGAHIFMKKKKLNNAFSIDAIIIKKESIKNSIEFFQNLTLI